MKKRIALLLVFLLLMGSAIAEGYIALNDVVTRAGYKASSVKNKTGVAGCWFIENRDGETLQWSDDKKIYTVNAKPNAGLKQVYANILDMVEWETCSYTLNGQPLYAFNAPELNASKEYKTLRNYVKFVSQYVQQNDAGSAPRRGYILNTNSKKFHLPDCSVVKKIKKSNLEHYDGTRKSLIEQGYEPCKKCKP